MAAAYGADVAPTALLSMINASDRAALDVLVRRVEPGDARLSTMIDTLMRLFGMETELTVELYAGFNAHHAAHQRDRLAAAFHDGIAATVADTLRDGDAITASPIVATGTVATW